MPARTRHCHPIAPTSRTIRREQNDKIDLHAIDAKTKIAGNHAFHFVTGAFTAAAELRFDGEFVFGAVNGDARPDFRVRMVGAAAIQGPDVIL